MPQGWQNEQKHRVLLRWLPALTAEVDCCHNSRITWRELTVNSIGSPDNLRPPRSGYTCRAARSASGQVRHNRGQPVASFRLHGNIDLKSEREDVLLRGPFLAGVVVVLVVRAELDVARQG